MKYALFLILILSAAFARVTVAAPASSRPSDVNALVFEVKNDRTSLTSAGVDDDIRVNVVNLDQWLAEAQRVRTERRLPAATIWDLVPILNGKALNGVTPDEIHSESTNDPENLKNGYREFYYLTYHLKQNQENKATWNALLRGMTFSRPVTLTVGFADMMDEAVPSSVKRESRVFNLVVIRTDWRLWVGVSIFVIALVVFWWLAKRTDLLRDTTSPVRPDGKYPFSLARTQMAFWFFLAAMSFFLLWIVTGDKNTLTPTVVTLIGISAGTALGAAVVDAGKRSTDEGLPVDFSKDLGKVKQSLTELKRDAEQRLTKGIEKLKLDLSNSVAQEVLDADRAMIRDAKEQINSINKNLDFFNQRGWKVWLYDLLGEQGMISFHRYQMFVWTLVLGVMFVNEVIYQLSMPEFSGTLLGLMGVSAGTYIGFKIPEKQ